MMDDDEATAVDDEATAVALALAPAYDVAVVTPTPRWLFLVITTHSSYNIKMHVRS